MLGRALPIVLLLLLVALAPVGSVPLVANADDVHQPDQLQRLNVQRRSLALQRLFKREDPYTVKPPSNNWEMAQLLRGSALGARVPEGLVVEPIEVLQGHFVAVKLPGNGWDALVINRMMQQDKNFLVEGRNGKFWQFLNKRPVGFEPRYIGDMPPLQAVLTGSRPTVTVPGSNVAEGARRSMLTRFFHRIRGVLFNRLPDSVQPYIHRRALAHEQDTLQDGVLLKRESAKEKLIKSPSSNGEMAQLLRTPSLRGPTNKVVVDPLEVLMGRFLAVKLPGNGWDSLVINKMMQQDRDFIVRGRNGQLWKFVNRGNRDFKPQALRMNRDARWTSKSLEHITTVRVPSYPYIPEDPPKGQSVLTRVKSLVPMLPNSVRPVIGRRAVTGKQDAGQGDGQLLDRNIQGAEIIRPATAETRPGSIG